HHLPSVGGGMWRRDTHRARRKRAVRDADVLRGMHQVHPGRGDAAIRLRPERVARDHCDRGAGEFMKGRNPPKAGFPTLMAVIAASLALTISAPAVSWAWWSGSASLPEPSLATGVITTPQNVS